MCAEQKPCEDGIRKKLEKKHKIRTKSFDIVIAEVKQDVETNFGIRDIALDWKRSSRFREGIWSVKPKRPKSQLDQK